jgi:hypothetical protein
MPVPSRVQVKAHAAASAVQRFHQGKLGSSEKQMISDQGVCGLTSHME